MATLREAIDFAKKNPDDARSTELIKRLGNGSFDNEAAQENIDLTAFKKMYSTGNQQQKKPGFFSRMFNRDVGAVKGVLDLPREAASLGSDIAKSTLSKASEFTGMALRPVVNALMTPEQKASAHKTLTEIKGGFEEGVKPTSFTEPTTKEQKQGFAVEKVGEFFTPMGAEKAGAKILEGATKMEKAIPFISKAFKEGFESAVVTSVQEEKAGKESAVAGLAVPAAGVVGKGLSAGSKKLADFLYYTKLIPSTPTQAAKDIARGLDIGKAVGETGISISKKSLKNKIYSLASQIKSPVERMVSEAEQGASGVGYSIDNIAKEIKNDLLNNKSIYKRLGATPGDLEKVNAGIDDVLNDYKKLYKDEPLDLSDLQELKENLGAGLEKEFERGVGAVQKVKPFTEIKLRSKIQHILENQVPGLEEINKELSPLLEAGKRLTRKGKYSGYLTDLLSGGFAAGGVSDIWNDPVDYAKRFLAGVFLKRAVGSTLAISSSATLLNKISKAIDTKGFRQGVRILIKQMTGE